MGQDREESREEPNYYLDPRGFMRKMERGEIERVNLDSKNFEILMAEKQNMLLTKPAFRGVKWSRKMLEIERNLKNLIRNG